MTVDERQIRYVFSSNNVKNYIRLLTIIIIVMLIVLVVISIHVFNTNKEFYYNRLVSTEQYKTDDIRLLCSVIGCEIAYINQSGYMYKYDRETGGLFKVNNGNIENDFLDIITLHIDTVIEYKDYIFIVSNHNPAEIVFRLFVILTIIIWLSYSILFYNFSIKQYKQELYDKSSLKNYIENKSQRSITEMIHHEMVAPIAVIRSQVDTISRAIFNENCKYKRSYDIEVKKDIESINLALCRLDAILEMLRDSKQIKNSDSLLSIYEITNNIINTVRCFNIGKIECTYNHIDILKKFAIDKISNGMFLNIIQVMINNSVEAKANYITFDAEILSFDKLALYITDNGRGIRDKFNRIVKNSNDIYKYGYTTKSKTGENIVSKNRLKYLLSLLGIKTTTTSSVRGIGLNLNKQLLNKIGGDIAVVKTSEAGTTFKLVLPVKKINDKINKENDKHGKVI